MEINEGFDLRDLEQLAKDLETVADIYPVKAQKFMRAEAKEARNRLRQNYKLTTRKKTGNLLKGIKTTRVQKFNGDYQIRVKNVAPHAHLIEHGHVQWKPVPGKGRKYQQETEQFVEGKHVAAYTVRSMKATMPEDASKLVDEVLREGGLG